MELVFQVVWQTLERDRLVESLTDEHDLVLFEHIVHRRKRQQELLHLGVFRLEADVKRVELFLSDRLIHVAFKTEHFVCDGVETRCGSHLSFVFQDDREDAVFANPGLLELKHWGAVSFVLVRLLDLQGRKGTLAAQLKDQLSGFVV